MYRTAKICLASFFLILAFIDFLQLQQVWLTLGLLINFTLIWTDDLPTFGRLEIVGEKLMHHEPQSKITYWRADLDKVSDFSRVDKLQVIHMKDGDSYSVPIQMYSQKEWQDLHKLVLHRNLA